MIFDFEHLDYFKYCFLCKSKNHYKTKDDCDNMTYSENLNFKFNGNPHFLSIYCRKCTNQQLIFYTRENLFNDNKLDLFYQYLFLDPLDFFIDYLTSNLRIFDTKNNQYQTHSMVFNTIPTIDKLKTIYNLKIFL
jgi:hypothetical protein